MDFDYLLAGGGLQSGLIVQALRLRQRNARIAVCERETRLGGNHTWSFHEGDVPSGLREAVEPLIVARWPGYDVHFPGLTRHIPEEYATISSERFDAEQLVHHITIATGILACVFLCAAYVERSHVGILVGHGTMMLGWWGWYLQGYSGVAETLPLVWLGR
ncbi:MAG: lycopene cyclase family protein [Myxococcaceae bacterium]